MTRLSILLLIGFVFAGCASSSATSSRSEAESALSEARRAIDRAEVDAADSSVLEDARREAQRAQALLDAGAVDEAVHRAYVARQSARLAAVQAEIDASEQAVETGSDRIVITDAFQTARITLQPDARDTVDRIAAYLLDRSDRVVLIESFTDATGNPERNLDLSIRRADAIKERMVEAGVTPEQVVTVGFGQEYPVAENETAEGQRENRRVEIVIAETIDLLPSRQ